MEMAGERVREERRDRYLSRCSTKMTLEDEFVLFWGLKTRQNFFFLGEMVGGTEINHYLCSGKMI